MSGKIGLFDSGIGGLSVFARIKKHLPDEGIIFIADQANHPYGKKSTRELKIITAKIAKFLIEQNVKLLVVACNTATCFALDHLRDKFSLPIVGVVPAVKPAGKVKGARISVMSTSKTAKSRYLSKLVGSFAKNSKVRQLGCDGLHEAIEEQDEKKINENLKKYLKKVQDFKSDTVVLGCTHYPLVRDKIEVFLGPKIKIIDAGDAIAVRVKDILYQKGLLEAKKGNDIFFTTGDVKKFQKTASDLLKYKVVAKKAEI